MESEMNPVVEAAKNRHEQAVEAFETACEAAVKTSMRAGGLAVALAKGLLRPDDAVAIRVESALVHSAEVVRSTRQARDAAAQALVALGQSSLWDRQKALVMRHNSELWGRYEAARAAAAAATDEGGKDKWERVLAQVGHQIDRYRLEGIS